MKGNKAMRKFNINVHIEIVITLSTIITIISLLLTVVQLIVK